MYLLAFSTLQGSRMVSPATNLNVSEREIKLGSGAILGVCEETVKTREKYIFSKLLLEVDKYSSDG